MKFTRLQVSLLLVLNLFILLKAEESKAATPTDSPTTEAVKSEISEAQDEANEGQKEEELSKNEPEIKKERQVFGWREWVKIGSKADPLRAKLDTGARTSSLHAEELKEFERNGQQWVQFILLDPRDENSKRILIKAPVERISKVKNTDGSTGERYVVELTYEIGGVERRAEFNLNDRRGFTCAVLLGRNILKEIGWVDCQRVNLADKKIFR